MATQEALIDMLIEENFAWINEIWDKIDKKMLSVAKRNKGEIPYTAQGGVWNNHLEVNPNWWTNGFWGGLMWLLYIGTNNGEYKDVAKYSEDLLDKAYDNYMKLHHDVGFMWHITSGVNYRQTQNEKSLTRNMIAANTLSARFNIKAGYIRAWNDVPNQESNKGYTIIDTMMNLPLLYWASNQTADERYKYIAQAHANMVIKDHIRCDGSVNHIVVHDTHSGEVIETLMGQGFSEGSSWSRGQAWALYGFVLSYLHTKNDEYLSVAKRVAHYFISCVCDDYLPKSDFRAPNTPLIYDSSAGAIAACGLIEIAKNVGEYEKPIYINAAIRMLKAMEASFCNWDSDCDPILDKSTATYHNSVDQNVPIIYGEYFFIEAIYKLKGFEFLSW